MTEPVIAAHNLTKRYGDVKAVDGISFTIDRGEIFGLLGPNGAGKTTTILMLLGLTEISAGEAWVLGHDPVREPLQVKRRVGYLPELGRLLRSSQCGQQSALHRAADRHPRRPSARRASESALARVGLADVANKRVRTFSRGMRQRLGLAEILMKNVEIAILDEPTSGLDPQATAELLAMIRDLKRDGVAVLISSHLLERVQSVCDRVALFHRRAHRPDRHRCRVGPPGAGRRLCGRGGGAGRRPRATPGADPRRERRRGAGGGPLPAARRPRRTAGRRRRDGGRRRPAHPFVDRGAKSRSDLCPLFPVGAGRGRERAMRREGSPWQGVGAVFLKEIVGPLDQRAHARAGNAGGAHRLRGALSRDPADQGGHRRGSVPVPSPVHHRARAAAVVRPFPQLPGSADGDRAGLRCGQRRAQPAYALAHPGAADLSRRAACSENFSPGSPRSPSACWRCGCWSSGSACTISACRPAWKRWRACSCFCW